METKLQEQEEECKRLMNFIVVEEWFLNMIIEEVVENLEMDTLKVAKMDFLKTRYNKYEETNNYPSGKLLLTTTVRRHMKNIIYLFLLSASLFANNIKIPQVETITLNAKDVAKNGWELAKSPLRDFITNDGNIFIKKFLQEMKNPFNYSKVRKIRGENPGTVYQLKIRGQYTN